MEQIHYRQKNRKNKDWLQIYNNQGHENLVVCRIKQIDD